VHVYEGGQDWSAAKREQVVDLGELGKKIWKRWRGGKPAGAAAEAPAGGVAKPGSKEMTTEEAKKKEEEEAAHSPHALSVKTKLGMVAGLEEEALEEEEEEEEEEMDGEGEDGGPTAAPKPTPGSPPPELEDEPEQEGEGEAEADADEPGPIEEEEPDERAAADCKVGKDTLPSWNAAISRRRSGSPVANAHGEGGPGRTRSARAVMGFDPEEGGVGE